MKKQKICIIGGGLTGLVTAISLSKLNLKVDLITDYLDENIKSNRTIAISQNNYDFLKKLEIFKFSKKEFWPCNKMKLYVKDENKKIKEIFELKKNQKQILFMIKNSKMISNLVKKIKKEKIINYRTGKKINKIITSGILNSIETDKIKSNYNLIIVCSGNNSDLVKKYFDNQFFQRSYLETSVTTILEHRPVENNTARQIFLDNEILAFLPISNKKTSIVWSIKKNQLKKYKNKKKTLFMKGRIKNYAKYFIEKIKFINKIEYRDLNLLIRKKYFNERILLFGDALHVVHPLAGQGFNMILRDLASLEKILKNKIHLGLDVGSYDTLAEFSNQTKSKNLIYSLGIDFLRNIFDFEKKPLKKFRNKIMSKFNKNTFVKDIFYNVADKGLKF